jgi:sugar lactone lactonase YvrE
MVMQAELAVDAHAAVGEGPVWDARERCLYWVDIHGRSIHRYDPATDSDDIGVLPQMPGAVAPRAGGGLVVACERGFGVLERFGADLRMVAEVDADDPTLRMNDGRCDPIGRFWAGTMAMDGRAGAGSLYRLDDAGRVTTVLTGVTLSNGIDWTPDGGTLVYVDSATRAVDAFDHDSGRLANRRRVVEIPPESGVPDGLTVDAEGFVWVALWGGGQVRRYGLDGRLDRVVALPVAQVTACGFGGPQLRDLYVTSAAEGADGDARAGALFRCRPGVSGQPTRLFKG